MMSRHPADPVSLVFGMLFAAVGLVLLTGGGWLAARRRAA